MNETPFWGGRCDVPCQILPEPVIPSLWSTDPEQENISISFKTAPVWHIPLSSADFKAKSAALLFPWSKSSTRCLITLEKERWYRRLETQIYEYGEVTGALLEHSFLFSCSFIWLEHSQLRKTQPCQVYHGEIRPCPFCCNLKWFATNHKAREENSASRSSGDLVCLLGFFFNLSASCASQALTHNQSSVPVKILLLDFFESTWEAEIHR